MSKITSNKIYQSGNYYWKLLVFKGKVEVIGKYNTLRECKVNSGNLIKFSEDKSYAGKNHHIRKHLGKYYIVNRIGGELKSFGCYDTNIEAVAARDNLIENNWIISDEESILNNKKADLTLMNLQDNFTLWQKLIFDVFNMSEGEVSFDELKNHRIFKPYKHHNFEAKLITHLNELIDLNLVSVLPNNNYFKLWH